MPKPGFKTVTLVVALLIILTVSGLAACSKSAPPPQSIEINGFRIMLYEPEVEFPDSINFQITVESATDISRLSLQYKLDKLTAIPVTSVAFPDYDPGPKVETSWKWDMRRTGGLPPGTTVTYWWSIDNADGAEADTPVQTLNFDDQRYSWRTTEQSQITLRWYDGGDGFSGALMTAAVQATERMREDVGAGLDMPVEIYVYATYDDLRGAMVFPQEWTGGAAYPEYGSIAIGIPLSGLDWGKRAIAHEIAHVVVHQAIFSGYGIELPTWLDEGLAMYSEGALSSDFSVRLQNAIDQDRVFTVRSLSSSFPADEESARLAYAQSYSLVSFLLEEHGGRDKMIELLSAFKSGSGYVEALDVVYGLDIDQLNSQWREYVGLAAT